MIEKCSLNGLKFFYFVATYESVTVASQKLFVTQGAVSKQVKNLEESLGVALFDRVNKSLRLTKEGQQLFSCCQQIFPRLDACLMEISHQNPDNNQKKQLVLSCEPTLSMKWLIPRLSEFNQLDLGFEIVLLTGGGAVNFKEKSIDLAIRRNDFEWGDDVYQEKIIDEYIVAVRNSRLEDNQTILLSKSRPNLWQHMTKAQLLDKRLLAYKHLLLEHFYLCIEGSLAGLGTAIVSIYMIEKELSNQFLEWVQPPVADGSAYYLLSDSPFYEDKRKVLFMNWLKQEMRKSEQQFMTKAPNSI